MPLQRLGAAAAPRAAAPLPAGFLGRVRCLQLQHRRRGSRDCPGTFNLLTSRGRRSPRRLPQQPCSLRQPGLRHRASAGAGRQAGSAPQADPGLRGMPGGCAAAASAGAAACRLCSQRLLLCLGLWLRCSRRAAPPGAASCIAGHRGAGHQVVCRRHVTSTASGDGGSGAASGACSSRRRARGSVAGQHNVALHILRGARALGVRARAGLAEEDVLPAGRRQAGDEWRVERAESGTAKQEWPQLRSRSLDTQGLSWARRARLRRARRAA